MKWYRQAEDQNQAQRDESQKHRDYYDNRQLTDEEVRELEKRGQPAVAFNLVRQRVEFMLGMERQQRSDPKAYPRNPEDEQAAEAFTDALRYVAERTNYHAHRSGASEDKFVEGIGAICIEVDADDPEEITIKRVSQDRFIYDPHSRSKTFEDARFLGFVIWMDADEAVAMYGEEAATIVQDTLSRAGGQYEDKPGLSWGDAERNRVRICEMWFKDDVGDWFYSCFTGAGVLKLYKSPYLDEKGRTEHPIVAMTGYVGRDNDRYSMIRDLIDPQDEYNKRRSKLLHLLTVRQVQATDPTTAQLTSAEEAAEAAAKPNGAIPVGWQIVPTTDLSMGQFNLLQQTEGFINKIGPNNALLGKGTEDQSGRAIQAQQQGGLVEIGAQLDDVREFDRQAFRKIANRIKQFWTGPKWIRVTDDEESAKFVGLNQPVVQPNPWTGEPVQVGVENDVASLEYDLIIDEAPSQVSTQGEEFAAFMQLLGTPAAQNPAMLELAIEWMPSLPLSKKRRLLDMVKQLQAPPQDPMANQMKQLGVAKAAADVDKTKADAMKSAAQAEAAMRSSMVPQMPPQAQAGAI